MPQNAHHHEDTAKDVMPTALRSGNDAGDAVQAALASLGSETHAERRAKRIVPWIGTFSLHAAVIVLGFLITWTAGMLQENEPVTVVADFHAMTYEPVVELEPEQDMREHNEPVMDEMRYLEFDAPVTEPMSETFAEPLPAAPNPISPPAMDFSTTTVEGSASFMGVSASNAQRVVYVIDASGSMIAYLQFILHELAKSLESLTEQQSYAIVFFQRNDAVAVPPARRFTPARQSEVARSLQWIDKNVIPAGRSNPISAIEHALRLQPDVVFILSVNITGAGHYEVDQSELLTRLDRLNPNDPSSGTRRTQINCIQFLDPDPLDTLRIIAEQHGGPRGYKFLSRQELGLTTR